MAALAYPVDREATRLGRWFTTAGAEARFVAAVAPPAPLRLAVEDALAARSNLRVVPLDVTRGELLPESFRAHRGSHANLVVFAFSGLAARVAAEGTAPLAALDAEVGLFARPATWTLLWLEDVLLPALLARHAPRLVALGAIRPAFADDGFETSALAWRAHLRLPAAADLEAEGERALARALAQDALTSFGAAAASGGSPAGLALVLARLGDGAGARARAEAALASRPAPRDAARAGIALATLAARAAAAVAPAIAPARALIGEDAPALLALARAPGLEPPAIEELLRAALRAAGQGSERALAMAALARHLARRGARGLDEAATLVQSGRAGAGSTAARVALDLAAARIALERAAAGPADVAPAERLLATIEQEAAQAGLAAERGECLLELLAAAALREDLALVLERLEALEAHAARGGLGELLFTALERKAQALRIAGRLAEANGTLDRLEHLAEDLTWPDLEIRAFRARGEHLLALSLAGEARAAFARAAAVAEGIGDAVTLDVLRARA